MPAPRQMRYGGEELDTDAQAEVARALVEKLRSADAAEVAAGAEGLYKMTCFSSSVVIDAPEAMTDYDRAVFESGEGGSDGSDAADFKLGETHLDGHRYLMGDGFMVNEKEDADGTYSQK